MTCVPIGLDVKGRTQSLDVEEGKGQMTILTGDVRKYASTTLETSVGKSSIKGRTDFDNFVRLDTYLRLWVTWTNRDRKPTLLLSKPRRKKTRWREYL